MGERYFPYIVRQVLEPRDDMPHLPTIIRYAKGLGSGSPWRWTLRRKQAHVFTRRYAAQRVADAVGGELQRADQ